MELATIEMDQDKAKEAAKAYREAVRERRGAEDAELARAYRELAKGQRLIRLPEALAAGGTLEIDVPEPFRVFAKQQMPYAVTLPRLAICRADASHAWTNGVRADGSLRIQARQTVASHNARDVVTCPAGTFPQRESREQARPRTDWSFSGPSISGALNSMVPIVPPPLRPAHHLRNYHILWEAEWEFDSSPPPLDPALLKHIGGDLYAVLAVWDLTDIERAVLAGRELE